MTSPSTPLLAAVILLYSCTLVFSQTDSIAQSQEYYTLGMEVFNYQHRKQATELFTLSAQWNPKNAKAHLMAGKSIMLTVHKETSLPYFKKAWLLDKNVDEEILYLIGLAHHYSEHYDSAIAFYNIYNNQLARSMKLDKSNRINEVNRKIFECRNAILYKKNPVPVTITHLDTNINSEYPDYAPAITADGKIMFFTSRRPERNLNPAMAEDLEYFEEILYSTFENGKWQPAKNMPPPINTEFHNSCISISSDGRDMILYTDENGGDLLISYRGSSGTWSTPEPMDGINTSHIENSATLTADNKYLFFTSNRPGGYGGTDIYRAELAPNGRWTDVKNLGAKVNTEKDEEGVYISVSGQHLYFSSNGHAGMGDLDLYKTSLDPVTGQWSDPVNLGYPINSPENDIYFVLNADETVAYFSSVRKDNIGEQDIYLVDMRNWKGTELSAEDDDLPAAVSSTVVATSIRKEITSPTPMTAHHEVTINVTVLDAMNRGNLNAQLSLSGKGPVMEFTKKPNGSYEVTVKSNAASPLVHKLNVASPGYVSQKSTLYLGGFSAAAVTLRDTVYLQKLQPVITASDITKETFIKTTPVNVPIEVEVFFPHNSAEPLSYEGLKEFISIMKNSPQMKVELGGHTDNTGEENYNRVLSQQRAEAIKRYLIKQGIDAGRIKAMGYGSSKPVDTTNTKEGNRRNRRTEFTILQKD